MDREDAEDFRQFMAARSAALLRTAYLLTGDRGHAEDLVQNALTKAYRHWGKVRRSGVPEAYVRRILVDERNTRWHGSAPAMTSGGRTRTETITGGLMVDETATVVVRDTDGTPLPLVDVRTDLPRVPYPQF